MAGSLPQALQLAETIGYPVALKTASGILHKSEQRGIHLNLAAPGELAAAYQDLENRLGPQVLVQQMIPPGVELLLGLVNDAQFGPMLALGSGGIWVEAFKDYRLLLLPAAPAQVRQALLALRSAPLLQGYRGTPPVDLDAVVDAALRLASLAADMGDLIAELDINPLVALPSGAVVVDALVVPRFLEADGER